jgi:hypothetical protein
MQTLKRIRKLFFLNNRGDKHGYLRPSITFQLVQIQLGTYKFIFINHSNITEYHQKIDVSLKNQSIYRRFSALENKPKIFKRIRNTSVFCSFIISPFRDTKFFFLFSRRHYTVRSSIYLLSTFWDPKLPLNVINSRIIQIYTAKIANAAYGFALLTYTRHYLR